MKKILCYTFITFCTMFVGVIGVKAIELNISGGNSKGNVISVNIKDGSGNALTYDNSSISCNNSACTSAAFFRDNGRLISSNDVTFEFKINTSENKNLNFKIIPTDGGTGILAEKNYEINVRTKAPQTTQSATTTTKAKSNNNNLSSLTLTTNEGEEVTLSPSFSASVYNYSATVASTAKTVSVDAKMEDSHANLTINGDDDELVAGESNRITITVTAEDGTPKTYTIDVTREALTADATLKELTIKENKSFKLKENKYTYNVKISKNVDSLTLDYVASDENATVEVEGNKNLKNGSKVRITVTAEDGTKRVYTLNIVKNTTTTKKADTSSIEVEKNPLIIMGLSVIAFGLIGGIIYVIKK